jgi:hypothetical protein
MMTLVLLKGSTGTNRQTSKEGMMMLVLSKGCTGTNKQRGIKMMLVLLKGCTGTNKQRGVMMMTLLLFASRQRRRHVIQYVKRHMLNMLLLLCAADQAPHIAGAV